MESHGHIAFFYHKFYCELNLIEKNWGYAKLHYWMLTLDIKRSGDGEQCDKMLRFSRYSKNTKVCTLKNSFHIYTFAVGMCANDSARFVDAY